MSLPKLPPIGAPGSSSPEGVDEGEPSLPAVGEEPMLSSPNKGSAGLTIEKRVFTLASGLLYKGLTAVWRLTLSFSTMLLGM